MVQPPLGQLLLDGNIEWASIQGAEFNSQSHNISHGSPWFFVTVVATFCVWTLSLRSPGPPSPGLGSMGIQCGILTP